jgi:hypothetical protein
MMRMRKIVLLLLLTIGSAQAADLPVFMTGSWTAKAPDGSTTDEQWMNAAGGMMLGMGRSVSAKGTVTSFEFLRIAPYEKTIAYYAMPEGKGPTPFPLKSLTAGRVIFENPKHDFPQRIIYWRQGADLCARIEGMMNGKEAGEEWCWKRAK